jgi:hypothetical protein
MKTIISSNRYPTLAKPDMELARAGVSSSRDYSKLPAYGGTIEHNIRKMSVVNMEAALACWKTIENHKIIHCSHSFRNRISSEIRITPARLGELPQNLARHLLSED